MGAGQAAVITNHIDQQGMVRHVEAAKSTVKREIYKHAEVCKFMTMESTSLQPCLQGGPVAWGSGRAKDDCRADEPGAITFPM